MASTSKGTECGKEVRSVLQVSQSVITDTTSSESSVGKGKQAGTSIDLGGSQRERVVIGLPSLWPGPAR